MAGSADGVCDMGVSRWPPEVVAALVERSCTEQGVPVRVADAGVLQAVAVPPAPRDARPDAPGSGPGREPLGVPA